ncbi:enoyl-CoA hydratase/isomerase family protein [Oryzifoliimicrobium ureilyticus]|uniref:enoyl-CoA hydratase/isomerase family protein n=1 Tax=Oryzifoliimicrobium ureilyticus TaxID=3113724 RepID=UPI003076659E
MKNLPETLKLERPTPAVAYITFANPPANLLTPPTIDGLRAIIMDLEQDPTIQVAVFRTESQDFFFNHFDGATAGDLNLPADPTEAASWTDMVLRLSKASFVSIAVIRGRTRGGGNELALACDLRYASLEKASFGQPEVGIGIVPGGGGAERLPRTIGRDRAFEAILTSADYDAEIAERWGWVTRALPDAELDGFVNAMIARLASFDRNALATAKSMVNRATLPPDADLVTAFREFMGTLTRPGFYARAGALGELVAQHGMDVEMRLGEFLSDVNPAR